MEEGLDERGFIQKFRDITNNYVSAHKEDMTVKTVQSIIDKFSKVIQVLDKFLKDNGVNAGELKDKAKDRAKRGMGKLTDLKNEAKSKGILAFAKEKADTVKGKLGDMFKSDTESAAPPPENFVGPMLQSKANPFAMLVVPIDKLREKIGELTKVNETTLEQTVEAQKKEEEKERKASVLERFKQSFAKSDSRAARRAKEIEDEKAGSKVKDKKEKGPFGSIISALAKGFGSLITFLPKLIGNSLGFVLKHTLTGVFGKLLPALVPGLAKGTQTVVGGLARGALMGGAGLLKAGAVGAGSALWSMGGAAATVLAPFAVPIAVTAAAVYGGYKLYKYLKRNDAGSGLAGKFTRLRLLAYGYNDSLESEYNKLFSLEELIQEKTVTKDGRVTFRKFDNEFRKKVGEIFSVTAEEKDKFKILNDWFGGRFLPGYTAFMRALATHTPIRKLDELEKLSDQNNFDLATNLTFPSSIYDIKIIPFFDSPQSPVSKDQIDDLLTLTRKEAQDAISKNPKTSPEGINNQKKKELEKKISDSKVDNANIKANNQIKAPEDLKPKNPDVPLVQPPPLSKVPNPSDKNAPPATVFTESEVPPKDTKVQEQPKPLDGAIGQVKKASGPLVGANQSLEGIRTDLPKEKIFSLDKNVFALFTGMTKEYKDLTGKDIQVNEGFRTRQDQEALYRKYGKGRAAAPGSSLHEHGLAIDIASVDAAELEKMGLLRKYGFTRPVGGETWHLEPAGVSLNPKEARDNPSTREARVLSSPGRGGAGYGSVPKKPEGGRNIALQKQLFDQSVGTTVDVAKLKKDQEQQALTPVKQEGLQPPTTDQPKISNNEAAKSDKTKAPEDALSREDAAIVQPPGATTPKPMQPPTVADLDKNKTTPKQEQAPQFKPNDGSYTGNANLQTTKPGSIEEIVRKAAQMVGVNPETMLAFAKVESSLRAGVSNSMSSAKGLFQIVGRTWKYLVKTYGPKFGVSPDASPNDPMANSLMGAAYAKENLAAIGNAYKKAGLREDTALYLAHHFGPSGAKNIISAHMSNPNAPMSAVVSPQAYASNAKELQGKTVGQYSEYLNQKLSKAGSSATNPTEQPSTQGTSQSSVSPTEDYVAKPSLQTDSSAGPFNIPTRPTGDYAARLNFQKEAREALSNPPLASAAPSVDQGKPRIDYSEPIYPQEQRRANMFKDPLAAASIGSGVNSVASNINNNISKLTSSLTNPIGTLTGGINKGIGDISKTISGISQMPENFGRSLQQSVDNAVNRTVPVGISSVLNRPAPQVQPQQPSQNLSLDKTEALLGGMADTLIQIKAILETISKSGSSLNQSQPTKDQPPSQGSASPTPEQPVSFEKEFAPSKYAVSVSRRSLLSA